MSQHDDILRLCREVLSDQQQTLEQLRRLQRRIAALRAELQSRWHRINTMSGQHVYPVSDWIDHKTDGTECPCDPTTEYMDPETGLPYPDGPLVRHNRVGPKEPSDGS